MWMPSCSTSSPGALRYYITHKRWAHSLQHSTQTFNCDNRYHYYHYHCTDTNDNIKYVRLTAFPDMLAMSRSWLKTPTTVSLAGTNIVCCLERLDCRTQRDKYQCALLANRTRVCEMSSNDWELKATKEIIVTLNFFTLVLYSQGD